MKITARAIIGAILCLFLLSLGAVCLADTRAIDGISLDSVSGLTPNNKLMTGVPITFFIHIKNTDNIVRHGIGTGFRIYSPDGTTWGGLTADTVDFGWSSWGGMFDFGGLNITYLSATGSLADTVAYTGVSLFGGMPGDFDETSFALTIGPIGFWNGGRTICLDSAFYPPAGEWVWADADGVGSLPPWGGPYTFVIDGDSNMIYYSGHLYYQDPEALGGGQTPVRNSVIEMWDKNTEPDADTLVATTITDGDGYFEFDPVFNYDGEEGDKLDIFFRILADNEGAIVTAGSGGNTAMIETPVQDEINSDKYDTTIIIGSAEAGPFYIATAISEARDVWRSLTNLDAPKAHAAIEAATYYDFENNILHIGDGAANPDLFDKDIILRQYGYFLEDSYEFFNQDWADGERGWDEIYSVTTAARQGFATFLSCVFRDDYMFRDISNNVADTNWINAENGRYGTNEASPNSANNYGPECAGAVCGILWDIYDGNDDDYSANVWPPDPPPNDPDPDGIGDSLSLGAVDILDVLLNRMANGHRPHTIREFRNAWSMSPPKGHPRAISEIWIEHGPGGYICGDANADGLINIGDAVCLVSYIFRFGLPPVPIIAGDANNSGDVDLADVVYIINYAFRGGPAPCADK